MEIVYDMSGDCLGELMKIVYDVSLSCFEIISISSPR
jgi:hypothetical protein